MELQLLYWRLIGLRIDNPGTGTNDSPLKYPSLTFKWFKEPSLVPIATTPSLTVNQPGRYYVEITMEHVLLIPTQTESQFLKLQGVTATITSSKGNPFALQQVQQH
jgi:hypothetical protein